MSNRRIQFNCIRHANKELRFDGKVGACLHVHVCIFKKEIIPLRNPEKLSLGAIFCMPGFASQVAVGGCLHSLAGEPERPVPITALGLSGSREAQPGSCLV